MKLEVNAGDITRAVRHRAELFCMKPTGTYRSRKRRIRGRRAVLLWLVSSMLAAGALSVPASAFGPDGSGQSPRQETDPDPDSEATRDPEIPGPQCVMVRRIRNSIVLDDQRILLDMAGGDDYVMHLRHACPQLEFHKQFGYRVRMGRLCARLDNIVTRAGFQCRIDRFTVFHADAPEDDNTDETRDASGTTGRPDTSAQPDR